MASSQAKPMPQTIEGYQALADRDLILIESMRDEIGMLKAKINKLEQKLKRNNVVNTNLKLENRMSETVHYKGVLTPTGKTLQEFDSAASDIYALSSAVEIDGLIYTVDKDDCNGDDIFESEKNEDGTIFFQVKYYNGGCGFHEAIDEALKSK